MVTGEGAMLSCAHQMLHVLKIIFFNQHCEIQFLYVKQPRRCGGTIEQYFVIRVFTDSSAAGGGGATFFLSSQSKVRQIKI